MKNTRYMLSLALALCMFFSCVKDEEVKPTSDIRTVELKFGIRELKSPAATAKSSAYTFSETEGFSVVYNAPALDTRQGDLTEQESEIHDILIVQLVENFDPGEGVGYLQIIGEPQYFTEGDPDFPLNYDSGRGRYTVNFEYSETESMLIAIANSGDPNIFDAGATYDLEDFAKRIFVTYESEEDVTRDGKIVMCGASEIYPGNFDNYIYLQRVISKIQLTVNYKETLFGEGALQINSVQLCSVPRMSTYLLFPYYNWDGDYIFPPVSDNYDPELGLPPFDQIYPVTYTDVQDLFMDYPAVGDGTIPTGSTFSWYMPEHFRGNNSDIYSSNAKYREYDPSYLETGVSYSTRIEIKGKYMASKGGAVQDITFTIYPGDNDNNFDIIRNSSYDIIVTIKSIIETKGDLRIEASAPIKYQ